MVHRIDLNVTQDLFAKVGGHRHSGQIRLDITNFSNLLNSDWGVGHRLVNTQILTSPTIDGTGKLTYNLQTLNGNLITNPLQTLGQHRVDPEPGIGRLLNGDAQLQVYVPIGQ